MKPHVLGLFFCHVGSDTISGRIDRGSNEGPTI